MPDEPSPEVRQDYDALLQFLMPFAQQMLNKHGEFFPFGAGVNTNGEVEAHATYDGNEMPASEEVIAMLVQGFQGKARDGSIRSCGICFDGRIVEDGEKVDAVIFYLEHVSGDASKVYTTYKKGLFGKHRFGEIIGGAGEAKVFGGA